MSLVEFNTGKFRDKHCSWKGGRYLNDSGYVMVYNPEHSRSSSNGYVREHILLIEKAIGKPFPFKSQTHHYGDISDNTKIILCENQEYHYLLHIRADALKKCGNANFRRCKFCKEYDDPKNMHVKQIKSGSRGWNCYHLECARVYDRERYKRCPSN